MSTSSGGDDSVANILMACAMCSSKHSPTTKAMRNLEDWSAVDRIRIAALDDQIEAFAGRFAQEYEQLYERFHEFEARSRSRGEAKFRGAPAAFPMG